MLGSVQAAHRATQQLLRVDEEDPSPLKPARERELIARLKSELRACDGVLVSDIDKGMLTPPVLRALIDGGRARGIPVIIDPRRTEDFSIYRGATALTPNRHETEVATGVRLTDRGAWRSAAETLVRKLDLDACLITLDRDGMYLAERGGRDTYVPTAPREVYDVTGAGDVVLSVFGTFTIAGLGFSSAATIANLAASIEVTRIGTEVITREDLARALAPSHETYERKIHSIDELKTALDRERHAGRRIAFTNGCFDLLHAGHIQALAFARAQADLLVVGLNSDRSVRELKGDSRPIYVAVFDETRAEKIIRAVKPDVLIKGEDWRGKRVDGQAFVEARGGRVALAPLLGGRSTSATIDRMSSGKSLPKSAGKNGARSDR
jgi:D-beta-D-heptose 7-phosphate kinase/D-beta-D-heptose 1-phosphate adenosyltransferase